MPQFLRRAAVFAAFLPVACQVDRAASDPNAPPAPAAARATLIVLNKNDASASLIDPVTGVERQRVPVGVGPHEVAVAPDGRTAVVCNYGDQRPGSSLTVFDVEDPEGTSRTIDLGRFLRPHGIQFLPDGKRCVVTAEQVRRLVVVDLAAGAVVGEHPTKQRGSHMVALAADGRRAYVSNLMSHSLTVIDLEAGVEPQVLECGREAEGIAVRPGSTEVWIGNRGENSVSVLDPDTMELTKYDTGAFPIRVEFTPDGRHALLSCAEDHALEVWDATRRTRVATVSLLQPGADAAPVLPVGIEVAPDGGEVYVAGAADDTIHVIDTATWTVVRRFAAGPTPDGMAWARS